MLQLKNKLFLRRINFLNFDSDFFRMFLFWGVRGGLSSADRQGQGCCCFISGSIQARRRRRRGRSNDFFFRGFFVRFFRFFFVRYSLFFFFRYIFFLFGLLQSPLDREGFSSDFFESLKYEQRLRFFEKFFS
jgi:hypothetical protein